MQRVVIVGAGGHAMVVADVLRCARAAGTAVEPLGYLDDDPALHGEARLGLPILGALADLARLEHDAVIVAVGNNATRSRIYQRLYEHGEHLVVACHPSAIIASDVVLGPGTVVGAGVIVNPGAVVGANVILNTRCIVEHHNRIGDHVHIAPGAQLGGDVRIGAGTLVGIGATVLSQQTIGAWSVVGAGAVVVRNLPERVIAVGVPARFRQTSEHC